MSNIQLPPSQRTQTESEFYNRYAQRLSVEQLSPLEVLAPTCSENVRIVRLLGNLAGKRLLDIGCGQGDTSVWFALRGAEVWAIDVSDQMIRLTQQLAARYQVADRVHTSVCWVEKASYDEGFFDVIFADGVLHHLDMRLAVPNLVRMLKPGGQGVFIEPQRGSVFVGIYRRFARNLRTRDERPLEPRDFEFLRSQFGQLNHREYHLVSLFLFAARFASLKLTGKAFPYWMDEVRQGRYHGRTLLWLQHMDECLLHAIPWLRRYCWLTVIAATKNS